MNLRNQFTNTDILTLVILRGAQGIGAAAQIPASVRRQNLIKRSSFSSLKLDCSLAFSQTHLTHHLGGVVLLLLPFLLERLSVQYLGQSSVGP
jgi:hypothetical protein